MDTQIVQQFDFNVNYEDLFDGLELRTTFLDYYSLKNEQRGIKHMTCNRYVSELDFLETDYLLRPRFKLLLDSAVNTGKTHYVMNTCLDKVDKVLFLADTKILGEQMANKYHLPFHCADTPIKGIPNQCVTIYDHIWKFAPNGIGEHLVILDEAHSLITQRSFRRNTLVHLVAGLEMFDRVIGLTGSFIPSHGWNDWDIIRIKAKDLSPNQVKFIGYEDELTTMCNIALKEVSSNRQVVIYLQDKSLKLPILKQMLITKGITADNITCVNSDTLNPEGEMDIVEGRNIILNEDFTEQILITTYSQGYNIAPKTPKEFAFICEPNRLVVDIIQAMNRIRTGLKSAWVLSNATEINLNYLDALQYYEDEYRKQAKKVIHDAIKARKSPTWMSNYIREKQMNTLISPYFQIEDFEVTAQALDTIQHKAKKDVNLLQSGLDFYGTNIETSEETFNQEIKEELTDQTDEEFLQVFYQLKEVGNRLKGKYAKFDKDRQQPLQEHLGFEATKEFILSCVEGGKLIKRNLDVKLWELTFKTNKDYQLLKRLLLERIETGKFIPDGKLASIVYHAGQESEIDIIMGRYLVMLAGLFQITKTSEIWTVKGEKQKVNGFTLTFKK